jgi:hypothetical protein
VSATEQKTFSESDFRIPSSSPWAGAWKKAGIVGVVGLAAAAYAFVANPQRASFSYLFAFFFFLSLGLGALFFVMIHHITRSGWSVSIRRVAEFFMVGLPVFAILVLPVIVNMGRLFPWLHDEASFHREHASMVAEPRAGAHGGKHEITASSPIEQKKAEKLARAHEEHEREALHDKKFYLTRPFFLARAVFYVAVWTWLALRFFRFSTDQDKSKKPENTVAAQRLAPGGLMLFAITLTFAGFDWLMSLAPMWYSTIFGVYVFACSVMAFYSTLLIVTLAMRRSGLLGDAVNVEHFHDLGKLLFGWLVFWAYISFAQFFLIWYSNIPEETFYYHLRWDENGGTWRAISLAVMVLHFAVPFWFLMSRNIKRRTGLLACAAVLLLVMQIVEMYWIVLPNFGKLDTAHLWMDLACFLGVGGIYLAAVFRAMEGNALIPVGDPRLVRALKFENA